MNNLSQCSSIDPYTHFAKPYSEEGELLFSEKMLDLIFSILGDSAQNMTHVVDLACGAGAAVQLLAEKGLEVIGIDISMHMLNEAKKRVEANHKASFYCYDMRDFRIPHPVDLVMSMYDSLNFMLTDEDLKRVFNNVALYLKPEGIFIFDMYTLHGLKEYWGSKAEIHTNSSSHFITTRTTCNEDNIGIKEFFGFEYANGSWDRWYEKHVIKSYSLEIIRNLLLECSFRNIVFHDIDNFILKTIASNTKRVMITAHKQ